MSKSAGDQMHDHLTLSPAQEFVRLCGRALVTETRLDEVLQAGGRLTPDDWRVVPAEAQRQGMTPIVYSMVATSSAIECASDEVARILQAGYESALINLRRIEVRLAEILKAFGSSAQDIIVLKGAPLARHLYRDWALRPVTDIDLLARPGELDQARAVLADIDYQPTPGQGTPSDFLALSCWTLLFRRSDAPPVELHWRLMPLPSYQRAFDSAELWRRSRPLPNESASASHLALEDELRYLCVHYAAQHHRARFIWLIDIAQTIVALPSGWDWQSWLDSAIEFGIAAPIVESLRDCQQGLGVAIPSEVIGALAAAATSVSEQRAWALAYTPFYRPRRLLAHWKALENRSQRLTLAQGVVRRYASDGFDFARRRLRRARHRMARAR